MKKSPLTSPRGVGGADSNIASACRGLLQAGVILNSHSDEAAPHEYHRYHP
jgi:hypothetical protein